MGHGRRAERIRSAAQLITAIQLRTGAVAKLLREGATADDGIGEMLQALRERQRDDVATGLGLIMGRPPSATERDGVWAIVSHEVCHLLVEESGWTPEQYEAWVEATLERVIPRS